MKPNLKFKLFISFGLVLAFFLINIIFNYISINNSNKKVIEIKEVENKQQQYAESINISVIQVQQFLTDVSATKNIDGFKDAEEYKNNFKTSITEFIKINPNKKDELIAIDQLFDKYYELGVKMANVYMVEGYEKGTILMNQFDPMAEALNEKITALNKESKASMDTNLSNVTYSMNMVLVSSIILGAISLFVMISISIILGRSITNPINNMLNILTDLEQGEGDLTKRISIKSKDELGRTSEAFNNFMDKLSNMIKNIRENSNKVSTYAELLNKGSAQTSEEIIKINELVNKLSSDSSNISNSLNEITINSETMAHASEDSTADVQEISSFIEKINNNTLESGNLALSTKNKIGTIETISANTMILSEQLGKETEEIKKIIDTIQSISNQTNILALNASIEAARAGEYGKGFVIVADEIRKLADNNNESSKTIVNIITNINNMIKETIAANQEVGNGIKDGNNLVEQVYNQIQGIIEDVKNINHKIHNITINSEQQTSSIQEVTASIESVTTSNNEIDIAIKTVSEGVNLQSGLVSDFNSMADKLTNSASELNSLVDKFKI